MPQATNELRSEWEEDTALIHLIGKVVITDGGILRPIAGLFFNDKDLRAIDYLCQEWDYGYNKKPVYKIL